MKTIIQSILTVTAVGAVCLLTGCETTGLSPRERSGVSYPGYVMSLAAAQTNVPAQIMVTPIRLAVAQVGEAAPPAALLEKLGRRPDVIAAVTGLPLPGEQGNIDNANQPKSSDEEYGRRMQSLCRLSRAAGADYVFVFGGNLDSWRNNNQLSLLDGTLIGGVLLPGGEVNVEGRGAGVLVEVTTGSPVSFVSADISHSAATPDFLANGKQAGMSVAARNELVGKLGDELLKKLAASSPAKP